MYDFKKVSSYLCWFFILSFIFSMTCGEGKLRNRRITSCQKYKCLRKITNSTQLDTNCRSGNNFVRNRLCYCCGGFQEFHLYGKVCLRYCLKTLAEDGRVAGEPCRPNPLTSDLDLPLLDKFFPDIPILLPESQLICD